MAPPFIIPTLRRKREIDGGLSCEIVSDLCPNPLSHDWHVQPSCQRPNRDPPERREFSPGELAQGESDCPRNLTNILAAQNPVNVRIPQNFHAISTLGKAVGMGARGAAGDSRALLDRTADGGCPHIVPLSSKTARSSMASRFGCTKTPIIRRTPKLKTEN